MPTTSAHGPLGRQPPAAPSVDAVLAACAAARTVSTPPSDREEDGSGTRQAAGEDRPAAPRAPGRDAA